MKRTMYFLLALFVALTLVVGVSCNGDNKAPEADEKYEKKPLGTESLVAPDWLYGTFEGRIPGKTGTVTVTISKTGITGIESILPVTGLEITDQYYIGYTYVLEYNLSVEKMTLEVVRQTYEDLEVSYFINGAEVYSKLPFTRVEQGR